jgi:hypothetical protein
MASWEVRYDQSINHPPRKAPELTVEMLSPYMISLEAREDLSINQQATKASKLTVMLSPYMTA